MGSFLQDLRYSGRTLARSPGFMIVALLTLALGIGANTAIFSFVDGVLLKPLPYENADRIVRVLERPPHGERNGISTLNFLDWQKDNSVFDFMAAQTGGQVTLTGVSEPVQLRGSRVSASYFEIFGIKAALGRSFLRDEDQLGKDRVVILSHALWVTQFGGDPSIINRTILLDNEPHTVIGVLPAGSAFDRAFNQLWRPRRPRSDDHGRSRRGACHRRGVRLLCARSPRRKSGSVGSLALRMMDKCKSQTVRERCC